MLPTKPLCILALIGSSFYSMHINADEPRQWTSADGKYTVVGEMLSLSGGAVILRKAGQAEPIRVPLEKLSKADREYATKQSKAAAVGTVREEASPAAQAMSMIELAPGGQWNLNSQLSIKLPPGAKEWKVQSTVPLVFVAESTSATFPNFLSLDCRGPHDMQEVRLQLLNNANEDSVRMLRERGAIVDKTPSPITGKAPPRYTGSIDGKLMDGTAVQCSLLVRFDPQGIFLFRAVGEPKFVNAAMNVAGRANYLKSASEVKPPSGKLPLTEAEMTNKNLPADKEKSLKEFVQQLKQQLKNPSTKELIENMVDPEDLKRILGQVSIENIIDNFERSNKATLQTTLDDINWSSLEYTPLAKQVSFQTQSSGRPIIFVETDKGWRLKN